MGAPTIANSADRYDRYLNRPQVQADAELVLDLLLQGAVSGDFRPDHRHKWVSALHVLTERIFDIETLTFQSDAEHHDKYQRISRAVLLLEHLDLVVVNRCITNHARQGNQIQQIGAKL